MCAHEERRLLLAKSASSLRELISPFYWPVDGIMVVVKNESISNKVLFLRVVARRNVSWEIYSEGLKTSTL